MTPNKLPYDIEHFIDHDVQLVIDRPIESRHLKLGYIYPAHYRYLPGITYPDGEDLDAHLHGVLDPAEEYFVRFIAGIHRPDDEDDKLVVTPQGMDCSDTEIETKPHFQEMSFKVVIFRK